MEHIELQEAEKRFRAWATAQGPDMHQSAEWETGFPEWDEVYTCITQYLATTSVESASNEEIDCLVYLLGRDNESEMVLEVLSDSPRIAAKVAWRASTTEDVDARWQSAVLAGLLPEEESRELREIFAQDKDPYVRSRLAGTIRDRQGD